MPFPLPLAGVVVVNTRVASEPCASAVLPAVFPDSAVTLSAGGVFVAESCPPAFGTLVSNELARVRPG